MSRTIGVIGPSNSGKSSFCRFVSKTLFGVKPNECIEIKRCKHITPATNKSNVHFIDVDGAPNRNKNTINALSQCDAIIYIVSAVEAMDGLFSGDPFRMMRRYLEIGHVFGVKYFIIAISKMDSLIDLLKSVSYSRSIFGDINLKVREIMDETNIKDYCVYPLSLRLNGDISAVKMPVEWYDTLYIPTLKEIIANIKPHRKVGGSLLFSVTHLCFSQFSDSEVILGKVLRGKLKIGDRIKVFPSGLKSVVISISRQFGKVTEALSGDIIGIGLQNKYFNDRVYPGDVLVADDDPDMEHKGKPFELVRRFRADIHIQRWSQNGQRERTKLYTKYKESITSPITLFIRNSTSKCLIRSIKWKQNGDEDRIQSPEYLEEGDSANVVIEILEPLYVTLFEGTPEYGAFFISDNGPCGVITHFGTGKVIEILKSTPNLHNLRSKGWKDWIFDEVHRHTAYCTHPVIHCDTANGNWWIRLWNGNRGYRRIIGSENLKCCFSSNECLFIDQRNGQIFQIVKHWKNAKLKLFHPKSNVHELNLDDIQENFALSSGTSFIAKRYCDQFGRKVNMEIPDGIIEILRTFCGRSSAYFQNEVDSNLWESVWAFEGKQIVKMAINETNRLFLERNGTVWEWDDADSLLFVNRYFVENKVEIRDVAVDRSTFRSNVSRSQSPNRSFVVRKHWDRSWNCYRQCFAVDSKGKVYRWTWNEVYDDLRETYVKVTTVPIVEKFGKAQYERTFIDYLTGNQ